MKLWPIVAAVIALIASGCIADSVGPEGAAGTWADEVVANGLDGPTQLFVADDGTWWLAQLAGGENDSDGQILRFEANDLDRQPVVAVSGLDKPTGVAVFGGELWVMERDRLTRGPLEGTPDGSDRVVVADDLPYNGRSQGTLTVDGDRLLYNTSGRLGDDGRPAADSGALWAVTLAPGTGKAEINVVADGFKHAYAHVRAGNGLLYTTEINDGRYDGEQADDELVVVVEGVNHGWPQCVGDNRLVEEYTAANGRCPDAPRSIVLFPAGATPTSVVAVPGRGPGSEVLAVALWNTGEVVTVPIGENDAQAAANDGDFIASAYSIVYRGAARPQHLTVDGDRLLLTDFEAGTINVLDPDP